MKYKNIAIKRLLSTGHYKNGINQAFKLSKDSVVGKLAMKNPPKDCWLNSFKRVSDLYDDVSKEGNHD